MNKYLKTLLPISPLNLFSPRQKATKVRKPVFIIGCVRSGTSMLFNLMSQHEALLATRGYPDGEDHVGWINHGNCLMAGIGNTNERKYGSGINGFNACLHMDETDVDDRIIQSMHEYYATKIVKNKSHMRLLNKQPHLSNKINYLLKIFPDAKIIHIIRECEAVVASCMAMMDSHPSLRVYWPSDQINPCLWVFSHDKELCLDNNLNGNKNFYPGGDGSLFVDYWNSINSNILEKSKTNKHQLMSIKYENLISCPTSTLSQITNFCDLNDFSFETNHILQNTKAKHGSRINPSIISQIEDKCSIVNDYYGYRK